MSAYAFNGRTEEVGKEGHTIFELPSLCERMEPCAVGFVHHSRSCVRPHRSSHLLLALALDLLIAA